MLRSCVAACAFSVAAAAQQSRPASDEAALAACIARLDSRDAAERRDACAELVAIGEPAVRWLDRLLMRDVSTWAFRYGGAYEDPDRVDLYRFRRETPEGLLRFPRLEARTERATSAPDPRRPRILLALEALRGIGWPAARTLVRLAEREEIAEEVGRALVALGPAVRPLVFERLEEPRGGPGSHSGSGSRLLDVLAHFPDALTPDDMRRLVAPLIGDSGEVHFAAVRLLRVGERCVPYLVADLASHDAARRRATVAMLGVLGREARKSSRSLLPLLQDPDADVRRTAIQALWRVSTDATDRRRAVELISQIELEDAETAVVVVEALGELLEPSALALATVRAAVEYDDQHVQARALESLTQLGASKAERLPLLVAALEHGGTTQWLVAVRLLGELGPEGAEPLFRVLTRRHEGVLVELRKALTLHGSVVAAKLAGLAAKGNEHQRQDAIAILGGLRAKPEVAQRALAALIGDKDESLCLWTLRSLQPPLPANGPVLPALTAALRSPAEAVRRECALALSRLGSDAAPALPALIELIEGKSHDVTKACALDVLKALGKVAKPALPALRKLAPVAGPLLDEEVAAAIAAIEGNAR